MAIFDAVRPFVLRTAIALCIILFTVPRAIEVTGIMLHATTHRMPMTDTETTAIMSYLQKTPSSALVAVKSKNLERDTIGPFTYFLSSRETYLSAPDLLKQFGADTFDRERNMDILTKVGTPSAQRRILKHSSIDYLVLDTDVGVYVATASPYGIEAVLQGPNITVFKVK